MNDYAKRTIYIVEGVLLEDAKLDLNDLLVEEYLQKY